MEYFEDQRKYWDRVEQSAQFTHPLDLANLTKYVNAQSRILDFGCGYGRTLKDLKTAGFTNLMGIDISYQMLQRARQLLPKIPLLEVDVFPVPLPEGSFDCVILFSVLTCQINDGEQDALMEEVKRLLRPDGIIYIADFPIQDDPVRLERYARFQHKFDNYGTFETDDGGVFRHLDLIRFRKLTSGFEDLHTSKTPVKTMHGNDAIGLQYFGRLI